jgi:hypothetical protein
MVRLVTDHEEPLTDATVSRPDSGAGSAILGALGPGRARRAANRPEVTGDDVSRRDGKVLFSVGERAARTAPVLAAWDGDVWDIATPAWR